MLNLGSSAKLVMCLLILSSSAWADDPLDLGGITLPTGYRHERLMGEDTFGGRIWKPNGIEIRYGSGGPGGDVWVDIYARPRPRSVLETETGEYIVATAFTNENRLIVSFIDRRYFLSRKVRLGVWNFSANVKTPEDVAEFMAIVMSYPVPRASPATQPAP